MKLRNNRKDLQPVAVRILNKIYSHRRILEADAVHFLMKRVCAVEIIGAESQMELLLSQIIRFFMILQPRKFHFKIRLVISDIDDDERTVRSRLAPEFLKAQSLLIKRKRSLKILHVIILMDHLKLHGIPPDLPAVYSAGDLLYYIIF